ncbi:hypothetical protein [Helicobacter suis]|nr:hypothetical protein [Helicobacter suis]
MEKSKNSKLIEQQLKDLQALCQCSASTDTALKNAGGTNANQNYLKS